jgi:hypothetical protein
VEDFCKQNDGLGLHGALLSLARPLPPLITVVGCAFDRKAAGMQRSCARAAAKASVT